METEEKTTPKDKLLSEIVEFIDSKFEDRYAALVAFKDKHGHCNVPRKWKEDSTLANWVSNTRQRYKGNTRVGRKLTSYEVKKLEEIGFEWTREPGRQVIAKMKRARNTNTSGEEEIVVEDTESSDSSSSSSSSSCIITDEEETESEAPPPKKKKRKKEEKKLQNSSFIDLIYIIEDKFGIPKFDSDKEYGFRFNKYLTSSWIVIDASKARHKVDIPPPPKVELEKDNYTVINCITDICPVTSITLQSFKYYLCGVNIRKDLLEIIWSDNIKK